MQVTDRLDVGFGLDVLAGYLNLDLDKDYQGSTAPMQPDYRFDVESEAFGVGLQGVVGLMYRVHPRVQLGAVYRSGARIRMSGETEASLVFQDGDPGNDLDEKSDNETRFRFPPTWGVGVAWQATDRLLLSADWQGVDWTKFYWPGGRIEYDDEGALLRSVNRDPGWFPDNLYRVGFEYRANDRWSWRGGYYCEESGGFPDEFEALTYTVSGEMTIVNVGLSRHWKNWTGDFLVGGMWGDREHMEHTCLTLAVSFRRQFGR